MMRTTLDIDEKLLAEVERYTGETSKSRAVNKALQDYLYFKAVQELRSIAGHVEFAETWEEMEEEEMRLEVEHKRSWGDDPR